MAAVKLPKRDVLDLIEDLSKQTLNLSAGGSLGGKSKALFAATVLRGAAAEIRELRDVAKNYLLQGHVDKYRDCMLRSWGVLVDHVAHENDRQVKKWGIQQCTLFEWLAFLTDEAGELSEAICDHAYREGAAKHVRDEAIQVATLALKIAEMIEAGPSDG